MAKDAASSAREKSGAAGGAPRWPLMALGGAVVVLVGYLALKGGGSGSPSAANPADAGADSASVAPDAASTTAEEVALDAGDPFGLGASESVPTERENRDAGVGAVMADGTPVPPLPKDAPRSVRFGVILVSYTGAQGAPANARSKSEAKELAEKLAAEAKTDFRAAVAHGDSGSSDDLGRITRGTLELAPEYILFTLASGQTSDPIDTPRGFWIVKRTD
ncbi:peptidylprolyl isomerase [Pendulispora albinea]|uniref:Peptidyl-prolyl cis-trans isomerase n=1 Tax=Pendulispora albinea TaxID=2741071 RepID=A0ABZ2LJG2_9BACT